jgi:argininosuccinate synthase
MVDDKWSELAYKGLVYEPLYTALNAFINTTQERVNGSVDLELYKGTVRVLGRSSPDAIYSSDLVSFDSATIDQCHAIGVSHYFGLQARQVHNQKVKNLKKTKKNTVKKTG